MKQNQHCQSGGTLVVAMIAVLVVSSAVGVAYKSTSATGRLGDRSRDFVENKLAAEGALEYAYGIWKKRVQNYDRAISTTEATNGMTAPAFAGFNYMSAAIHLYQQAGFYEIAPYYPNPISTVVYFEMEMTSFLGR